jgi:hypothetical protein
MRSNSFKERPVGFKRHFPETVTGNFDTSGNQERLLNCSREVRSFDAVSPRLLASARAHDQITLQVWRKSSPDISDTAQTVI